MNAYSTPGLVTSDRTVQEGGHNVVYDLLGSNHEFKKTYILDFYVGAENTQVITFPYPAFVRAPKAGGVDPSTSDITVEVLSITRNQDNDEGHLTTSNLTFRSTNQAFEDADEGWMIEEVDQDAMAKANYLWNSPSGIGDWKFNGTIVSKIRVKNKSVNTQTKLTLKVSYQAFYKDLIDSDKFRTETGPLYTREFGQFILDKLAELDVKTDINLENMFGNTSASEDILNEDLTGEAPENKVVAELHTIDTTTGKSLLAPAKGSFYPGDATRSTELELFLYHIEQGKVDEDAIASGEKLGWLFIYTLNNLTEFSVATDTNFLTHSLYYKTDDNGDFVRIDDYTPCSSIDEYRASSGKEVFVLKRIPFDPSLKLDGLINDSSAVITTQQSVVLTEDNIESYLNYHGTFVELTPSESGTKKLVLGEDYEFANVNQAKTERTFTRQPVYDHIRLLGNIKTDPSHRIGITYQAFGGQVQPKDVKNIRKDVTNLLNILAKSQLLTYKGLIKHPAVADLIHRIRRMEDYHHHFNQVDHIIPLRMCDIFKDPTTGSTTTSVADETSDLHWFNIAQLFDSRWMDGPNASKDIGHFRISSREQGWTYEFIITVDLTATGDNRMTVKTLGGTGKQSASVDDFVALTEKELVGLRLIWNGDGITSGAILQVGIDFSKYNFIPTDPETGLIKTTNDTDTITVTNKSGDTSSWQLYYNPIETTYNAGKYVAVYGHPRYSQVINEKAQASINYYTSVTDYTYFGTTSDLIRDGVDYFIYNFTESTYEPIEDLVVGTKVSDYDFPIYERCVERKRWIRATLAAGKDITKEDNVFVVDNAETSDSSSTTLPDGVTIWGETLEQSRSIARILERDDGGTVVWLGSAPLAYFSFGPNEGIKSLQLHFSLTQVFQKYLDIESIKSLDFTFYDRKDNKYFTKRIDTFNDDLDPSTHAKGEGFFFLEDLCGLTTKVGKGLQPISASDVFLAGVKYFTGNEDGSNLVRFDPESEAMIGKHVPTHEPTTDDVFASDRKYFKMYNGHYVTLTAGSDYKVGDSINDFSQTVYVLARNFFREGELIVADVDVALGTSSYINERFDLRQVRMHL